MTRQDYMIKWTVYSLALLPILCLECYVLNRFPVFGVTPLLLPLVPVIVAVFEGPLAGAGFGLAVGILADSIYPGFAGGMIIGLTFIGMGAGLLSRYVLHQNFLGCLICSFLALATLDIPRVLFHLISGDAALSVLLSVAIREILWSLVFTPLLFFLFRGIHRRAKGSSV